MKGRNSQRVIGRFGEQIVCNSLSCSGFDAMIVDHVGIDIMAYRKDVGRLGISVKTRVRTKMNGGESVNFFHPKMKT